MKLEDSAASGSVIGTHGGPQMCKDSVFSPEFYVAMGLFTPSRRKKPKRFTYEPRFYNPDKEEDIKRRMRVKRRKKRQRSPLSILYLIGLLSFAIFVMYSLG